MKYIVKVNDIQEAKDSDIRPIIALDNSGILFFEGVKVVPEGFVDLGLPSGTLWSTKNIGATNGDTAESWYGNYYAWGEIETKNDYSWSTYKFGTSSPFSKYDSDGKTVLESVDDIASNTNSTWRMPTKEDFEELLGRTTNSLVTNYNNISGLNGRVFTSKVNGNTLFIPAAGFCYGSDFDSVGSDCYLWSSSLTLDRPDLAYYLTFYSDDINLNDDFNRYYGFSVRPIC